MAKGFKRIKMAAIFWLGRRLPTCKELTGWMSESLEQRLSWRRQMLLKLHFLICVWCRRYNEQLLSLRHVAHRYASEDGNLPEASTAALSPEARERLKQALARAAK